MHGIRRRLIAALAAVALASGLALLPTETTGQVAGSAPRKVDVGGATVRYPDYPVARPILPIVPPRTAATLIERRGVATASPALRVGASKTARKVIASKAPLPGRQALGAPPPCKGAACKMALPATSNTGKAASVSKSAKAPARSKQMTAKR